MDSQKALRVTNQFHFLNKELLNIGATYSSLLIINDELNVVFSKSSNPDWSEEFTSSGLYRHCYLLKEASNQIGHTKLPFTLLWDLYGPSTDKESELLDIRNQKDISHGIGFCFQDSQGCVFR